MRIKAILIFIGLSMSFKAIAQGRITFHSLNMVGIAAGESGEAGILQTINGLQRGKWFAGIGTGVDYYKNKSIPLFVDVRMSLDNANLYVFGDLGYNFPFNNIPGKEIYYYSGYHFTGGVYTELGIGYKVLVAGKTALLISTGYSYKALNNNVSVFNECLVAPCSVDYSKYRYGYGRLVIKAGLSF